MLRCRLRSWDLQAEFVYVPANIINRKIEEEGSGYAAYLALAKDESAIENGGILPYPRLKNPRKARSILAYDPRPNSIGYNKPAVQREFQAAREIITKIQGKSISGIRHSVFRPFEANEMLNVDSRKKN